MSNDSLQKRSGEPLFNQDSLIARMGNRHLACQVAGIFLEESGELRERLQTAYEENDSYETLRLQVHNLKGTLSMLGSPSLVARAESLNRLCGQGNKKKVESNYFSLLQDLKSLKHELQAFVRESD